jgi:CubicO group peptidase (beta-lactamase class C family)
MDTGSIQLPKGVEGRVERRFARVVEVFAAQLGAPDALGAALAITVDGAPVVELWGGHADLARTRPWRRDTLVHFYSVSKGLTAACAHVLLDRGALALDAPVARYWPEFAQAGKGDISLAWLLSHRAGLPALRAPMPPESLYDWQAMCAALAAAEPCLPPGQVGYHPVTWGWLVGELVRRVDGRSLGRFLREEIAEPLGLDLHVGLGPGEEKRAAEITAIAPPPEIAEGFAAAARGGELPLIARAFVNPMGTGDHNSPAHRRAEIPAINGHGTALGLARFYGALARGGELDGVRILSAAAVERARTLQVEGMDALLGMPVRLGLGYWLCQPGVPGFELGPNPGAFGHPGAGGSLGFGDPTARVGFGFVTNQLSSSLAIDPRATALIDAFYAS